MRHADVTPGDRAYRLHGDVALDRPARRHLRRAADEPRTSFAGQRRHPGRSSCATRRRDAGGDSRWPLAGADWVIVVAVILLPLVVGLVYYRRAGRDLSQFFLSGRELPWWLSGTSMVATTFAADTPLAVTGLVAASGVAGNWLWWNAGLGTMLTVFYFSRLWRRAGITTDVELVELRYSGRPAALLRGFRAVYLGLPINCLIIGWVNLALAKVLSVTLGWDRLTAVLIGLFATGCYTALSGLRGVVVSDFLLFGLALVGTWAMALFALSLPSVGGLAGLTEQLPPSAFALTPSWGEVSAPTSGVQTLALSVTAFIAFLGVQWWASWYPGQEPGGGGYLAQRMMATKSERHSLLATLWFALAPKEATAFAPGPGSSSRWCRSCCIPTSQTAKPVMRSSCATTYQPGGGGSSSGPSSPPTCRRYRPN